MMGIPTLRTLDDQSGFRVWLATSPIDMRLGFDRLMELAKSVTGQAVIRSSAGHACTGEGVACTSEGHACTHLFVFRSRGGDRLKMLYWDQGGLILWYKRLGWIWDWQSLPFTANNTAIDHVRHAVAIEEKRSCYGANLFFPESPTQHQSFKQVWFAGCHCDVGGGYVEAESALSKLPLRWMITEAETVGLRTDAAERDRMITRDGKPGVVPDPAGMLHNSMKPAWWLVELFPRRSWSNKKRRVAWHWPNFFRRRDVPPTPCASQSALDRSKVVADYKPPLLKAPGLTVEP